MKIKLTYEVDDRYVGGSRPHYLTIYTEEYEDLTKEEIENQLWEEVKEDFLQKVSFIFEIPKGIKAKS